MTTFYKTAFKKELRNGFICKQLKTLSFLVLATVLVVSGCRPLPGNTYHQATKTLSLSCWGSVTEIKQLSDLIKQFEQHYPHIKVRLVHSPQQYFQKLHFMAASGMVPDVIMVNSWNVPVYAQAKVLKPLTVKDTDFFPASVQAMSWQGKVWAYPRDLSSLATYVNADMLWRHNLPLPSPDWTLHDLTRYRPVMSNNQAWVISFNEDPALFWLPWVWAYQGRLWNNRQDCLFPVETLQQSAEGLQMYANLRQSATNREGIAPGIEQSGSTPMAQLFLQGKLAFLLSGRWTMPLLREQASFKWVVRPLPAGPAGSKTGIDATGYAVSATSRHVELAERLAAFLTSQSSQKLFSQSGLIVPSRRSIAHSPAFLTGKVEGERVFIDSLSTGVSTQSSPRWNALSEQMQESLQPVWQGKQPALLALQSLKTRLVQQKLMPEQCRSNTLGVE